MNSKILKSIAVAGALLALSSASPAMASLPDPVRAMLDAAIGTGDAAKVDTVVELAKLTNPDDSDEIDALAKAFKDHRAERAAAEAAEKEAAIRQASVFEGWKGEGQIGASRSTGNTSNIGVSAGVELVRVGIDWRHKLTGFIDYQRTNGATSRKQYRLAYEPNYQLNDKIFLYALGRYEHSRFQGYRDRQAVSGGAGYRVIQSDALQLSVQGGPAWRKTTFDTGEIDSHIAGLSSAELDWKINDRVKFSQDANALVQSANSTFVSVTSVEASLGGSLSARLTYKLEHDTSPPDGTVNTDTLSRLTLVYGF